MAALDGKIVLITGCARYKGLGRGMALAFAQAGADLALTDVEAGGTRNVGEAGEDEARVGWRGLESLLKVHSSSANATWCRRRGSRMA